MLSTIGNYINKLNSFKAILNLVWFVNSVVILAYMWRQIMHNKQIEQSTRIAKTDD